MRERLRVAFLPSSPPSLGVGGAEVQAQKTKEFLEKRGHTVQWFDFGNPSFLQEIDILHAFGTGWHLYPFVRHISSRIPIVISPIFYTHSPLKRATYRLAAQIPQSYAKTRRSLLREADALLPNSNAEAAQLANIFGVNPLKTTVVPNGVEQEFLGSEPTLCYKKYLPTLPIQTPFIFSVHRIEKRKNTLNLIHAALSLKTPLVLVGGFAKDDAAYVSRVMRIAQKHSREIFYLGILDRSELKNVYAAAHVYAMPSYMETPGLASLEAGLNGCNVVVGECPPVREYFSGIAWIQRQDIKSVAAGIKMALRSRRNYFSQAEKIRDTYSWERVAELTESVYRNVLHKRSSHQARDSADSFQEEQKEICSL
jgi:glycosyltransferase involved in cell wall biosynthesis